MLAISLPLAAFTPRLHMAARSSALFWIPKAGPSPRQPPPIDLEADGESVPQASEPTLGADVEAALENVIEEKPHSRPGSPLPDPQADAPDGEVQLLEKEADVDIFILPEGDDVPPLDGDDLDDVPLDDSASSGPTEGPLGHSSMHAQPAEETEALLPADAPASLLEADAPSFDLKTRSGKIISGPNSPAGRRAVAVPRRSRPSSSTLAHVEDRPLPKRVPKPTDKIKAMSISAPPQASKTNTLSVRQQGKEKGSRRPPGKRPAEEPEEQEVVVSVKRSRKTAAQTQTSASSPTAPISPVSSPAPPTVSQPPSISAPAPARIGPPTRRRRKPSPTAPAQDVVPSVPRPQQELDSQVTTSASPPPAQSQVQPQPQTQASSSSAPLLDIDALEAAESSLHVRYTTLRAAYLCLVAEASSLSSTQGANSEQEVRQKLARAEKQAAESRAELGRVQKAFASEMSMLQRRLEETQAREAWFVKERGEMLRRLGMLFGFGGMGMGVESGMPPFPGPFPGPALPPGAAPPWSSPGFGGYGPVFDAVTRAGPSSLLPSVDGPSAAASTSNALVTARPPQTISLPPLVSTTNGANSQYGAIPYHELAQQAERSQQAQDQIQHANQNQATQSSQLTFRFA